MEKNYSVYVTIIRPDGQERKAMLRCNLGEVQESIDRLKSFYSGIECKIRVDHFSLETWSVKRY